jgi:hypothetical protein
LAYNFNNDILRSTADDRESPAATSPAVASADAPPAPAATPDTPAFARFRSCRWQQPKDKEAGQDVEFCTHREVKPYAGTTGFDPEAWCPDCQYYKLRRTPKKRPVDEFTY